MKSAAIPSIAVTAIFLALPLAGNAAPGIPDKPRSILQSCIRGALAFLGLRSGRPAALPTVHPDIARAISDPALQARAQSIHDSLGRVVTMPAKRINSSDRTASLADVFMEEVLALRPEDRAGFITDLERLREAAAATPMRPEGWSGPPTNDAIEAVLLRSHERALAANHVARQWRSFFAAAAEDTLDPTSLRTRLAAIRVDVDGAHALRSNGLPDYEALERTGRMHRLLAADPALAALEEEARPLVRKLAGIHEASLKKLDAWTEQAYQGREGLLRRIRISEAQTEPVDYFITTERFREIRMGWWLGSEGPQTPGMPLSGGPPMASITGRTSKSPLKKVYGLEATREIFWLNGSVGRPDLETIRIAMNHDSSGAARSIEVLLRGPDGEWEPFLYERVGDRWIPSKEFLGMPTKDACLTCHKSDVTGKVSPRPNKLKTAEDFKKAGYQDPKLIEALLRFH